MPQNRGKQKVFAKKLRKNLQDKKNVVPLHRNSKATGCSAVRLAHLLWEQGVPGSNPGIPTKEARPHGRAFLFLVGWSGLGGNA